jgi:hypothetical protein
VERNAKRGRVKNQVFNYETIVVLYFCVIVKEEEEGSCGPWFCCFKGPVTGKKVANTWGAKQIKDASKIELSATRFVFLHDSIEFLLLPTLLWSPLDFVCIVSSECSVYIIHILYLYTMYIYICTYT